jgi:membrane-associated phospholipid phosphatase
MIAAARRDAGRTLGGVAVALAILAVLGLVVLGWQATTAGPIQRLDEEIRRWVLNHQIAALHDMLAAVTIFGDALIVIPLFVLLSGTLSWYRNAAEPLITALTAAGLLLVSVGTLKAVVGRAAPNGEPASWLSGAWPSGHTATATVVYGLLALELRRHPGRRHLGAAALRALTVLIAISLVYCDFHWFTDVVAGLLLGDLLVATTQVLTRRLLRSWRPVLPPARRTASQNRS